jgi:CheY-like chemotaxis protein
VTGGRIRVLLVEDNSADVELILESLGGIGLTDGLRVARDGAQALVELGLDAAADPATRRDLPQLVLLDVKLPKLTGIEVLERLRGSSATRNIPVVMLTSSNIEHDVARCYELGANSYVQKPVEFLHFREVVQQIGRYWLAVNEAPPRERERRR